MSNKWIVTDPVDRLAADLLEELGRDVDWRPDIGREELTEVIAQYEGMVVSTRTYVDRALIDRASRLKIVARVGSGMEHIDQAYCAENGIACLSSPEGNCNAVAEHAFGMLLSMMHRIHHAQGELQQGIWKREENRGVEMKGRTVGIVGYGHTGKAFARKFAGWDVDVLVYDKYAPAEATPGIWPASMEEIRASADIISFHIPYNEETHHWIDGAFIHVCRPGVLLINTSRGAVADTAALLPALESGLLGGICLDVFEDEPFDRDAVHPPETYRALFDHPRVIATPHIAGWSRESKENLVRILIGKVAEALS